MKFSACTLTLLALSTTPALAAIDRVTTSKAAGTTSSAASSSSSSESKSPTMVWTTRPGETGGIQVAYTQSFPARKKTASSAPAGSIGLGTIKGTIGTVKSESFQTITVS